MTRTSRCLLRARRETARSGSASEGGVVAVEFALVMPLLLILVFGIVEFGVMLNRDMIIGNASRDAARAASLNASYDEVRTSVTSELAQSGIPTTAATTTIDICVLPTAATTCTNMTAAAYAAAATSGRTAVVKVTYEHSFLTPIISSFLGDSVSLQQLTQMRVE
jgi:Flp pilus assembly protein TadG